MMDIHASDLIITKYVEPDRIHRSLTAVLVINRVFSVSTARI